MYYKKGPDRIVNVRSFIMHICSAPSTMRLWFMIAVSSIAVVITLTCFKDYGSMHIAVALQFCLFATKCSILFNSIC